MDLSGAIGFNYPGRYEVDQDLNQDLFAQYETPDHFNRVEFVKFDTILYRLGGLINVIIKVSFIFLVGFYRKWLMGDLAKAIFEGQRKI
jgi:hypothetical protein